MGGGGGPNKVREGVIFQYLISRGGGEKKEEMKILTKGPSTKCDHFKRVSLDKKEENEGTIHEIRPTHENKNEENETGFPQSVLCV